MFPDVEESNAIEKEPSYGTETQWFPILCQWPGGELYRPRHQDVASSIDREARQMAGWSKNELRKIAGADDLHISPFRDDGVTYGTPTWIWSVVLGGEGLCEGLQRAGVDLVSGRS
jgi:Uncharacterized protein conserved in bacteria (DUF2255)